MVPKNIAIDPGSEKSAYLVFSGEKKILDFGLTENKNLLELVLSARDDRSAHLTVEVFKSYGNIIGDTVLETCVFIGRLLQAWNDDERVTLYTRKHVVAHICQNPRASDANIRQALLDRFERTGGGKNPSVGTKSKPGPLYGVKKDIWSALALALTYHDENNFLF